jgi:hypothetical protein
VPASGCTLLLGTQVNARVNGDSEVEAYCEAGRLDPGSGVLQVWLGNATHCPKPMGEPSYSSVKIGT